MALPGIFTQIVPLLAAGAAAWLVWYLSGAFGALWMTGTEKAMVEFANPRPVPEDEDQPQDLGPVDGEPFKIRLAFMAAGLRVRGWEKPALYLAYAACGLLLAVPVLLLGLPVVLVAGMPLLGFVAVNAFVDARWQQLQLAFDREVPVMLSRMASHLKANNGVIESLQAIALGLDPHKPLQAFVNRMGDQLHAMAQAGLDGMKSEAGQISPALLLAVIEIGRVWQTGGSGYAEALRLTAANLSDLLETRAQACAVGAGAWGAARTILLALGFTLAIVLVNPVSKAYFAHPLIQVALLVVMAWGGIGYWNIRDAINEVME